MSAQSNKEVIERFYTAFQKLDYEAMADCYADDVEFSDPAFQLKGSDAGMMWKMLCLRAKDFELTFSDIVGTEDGGSAHWEAKYLFGSRKVHNKIDATFEIKDGKIVKHVDDFDFHQWSKQSLGLLGTLFGSFSFFQRKVSQGAMKNLQVFKEKDAARNAAAQKVKEQEEATSEPKAAIAEE